MRCAILGVTGIIGQQFARMLSDHPMFQLEHVYASIRSENKLIKDIWSLPFFDCPPEIQNLKIDNMENMDNDLDIVFSALPTKYARDIESDLRAQGIPVFSNASAHRMDEDVPILIPEINGDHINLIKTQREKHDTEGFIITNSNCSAAGAVVYLGEVTKLFDIHTSIISTYQAVSGAGLRGVSSIDILNNVVPYVENEEQKIELETKRMLGEVSNGKIKAHPMNVIANSARVGVIDGHLEAITSLFNNDNLGEIKEKSEKLKKIKSPLDLNQHHVAPHTHLEYQFQDDRPQPKLDVYRSNSPETTGMSVQFGRLRPNINQISSFILVNNTIRGGAGGSVLNAEYAKLKGFL